MEVATALRLMDRYVELHCHSNFSLLDGASSPEDLVSRAAELGMSTLALTDHDAVYGAIEFTQAMQEYGIRPIFGAELTLESGHHLTLLVKDKSGWHNLCYLITKARHNAPKGEAALPFTELQDHTTGLIALSGCRHGEINTAILKGNWNSAVETVNRYRDVFEADQLWIELQHHRLPDDPKYISKLVRLAKATGLNYVATNNVHYATPDRQRLQDVLVCINHQTTLDKSTYLLRPNAEYYLKSADEMLALFSDYPEAISNTLHIAGQCQFTLEYGLQDLPHFPTPNNLSTNDYLYQLCINGLSERYWEVSTEAVQQLRYELDVIQHSNLGNYFLIVWDIVRFAHEHNILCQGRGSAANSLVAFSLGITPIDPMKHDLVFERFLSDERQAMPDIDIDFDAAKRELVIQYVYDRYGTEHTAMTCTYSTFRSRSAIRDIGKALGLPLSLLNKVTKGVDHREVPNFDANTAPIWQQLFDLCHQIQGFPRHLSIHNGGMIITASPLTTRVPTEPATMPNRIVVQWDKTLEELGLVKIDILGLRMLSAVDDSLDVIEVSTGKRPDLDNLTFDDPNIYQMITKADTVGVFQVESRAQAQVLPRLKPDRFNDLIVSISLIRPGPVQGNMVHPYLRRRAGIEAIDYFHPLLEDALKETLGVILFQEQVLKVARDLAGFTAGQGELLRRALSTKNAYAAIEEFRDAFVKGAIDNRVDKETAVLVFEKLRAFGGYSFAKSHAAAFAVLVYHSAWLKYYHPQAFYIGLLNNQPMGFWSPAILISDAKRHRIEILPVDVKFSQAKCHLEDNKIRLGFVYIDGIGEVAIERLISKREKMAFINLKDLCFRTKLPRHIIENLIRVGAMDCWDKSRRDLLWEFGKLKYPIEPLDLIYPPDDIEFDEMTSEEVVQTEYEIMGLSLQKHPLSFYRSKLNKLGILDSQNLASYPDGIRVKVAGLQVVRQSPPTAKGVVFLTLEDEFGFINIVLYPHIYTEYVNLIRQRGMLVIEGEIQHQDEVVNVVGYRMRPL